MAARPYLNKGIADLEAMFDMGQNDSALIRTLVDELKHRNVKRAQALLERVLQASEGMKTSAPRSTAPPTVARQPTPSAKPTATVPPEPRAPIQEAARKPIARTPIAKPPVTNKPTDILSAWTALEVLSPQGFRKETDLVGGDKSLIARFEKAPLPWETEEKSRPKKRLYYEIYIGTIALAPAVEALLNVYADARPDKPSVRGFSPIASVILDKEGRPLEDDSGASISSFAWGVPIALEGDLRKLADWSRQHEKLLEAFRKKLFRHEEDESIMPLTKAHVDDLYDYLVATLNLQGLETNRPYFVIRRFEYFANKTPPEPGLLNSFFLEDLAAARGLSEKGQLPLALRHYLGAEKPPAHIDLLNDEKGLCDLLQPSQTPPGRWPANGRFPLALLQQAAVNATHLNRMPTGILAVNGPPGTGKTTLLRDVVAARLVSRAAVMCRYDKPAEAFTSSGESVQRNSAKISLHRLDEQLKGYEMIVASSNNKAVENVSVELPAAGAIAADAPELRYFKTISDNVLDRDTWGLAAAVLGNASNRFQFSQAFWRDEELGMSTYLNHACGVPQFAIEPREDGTTVKRIREVVKREKPPENLREALGRWKVARGRFASALRTFQQHQSRLQTLHDQLARIPQVQIDIARDTAEHDVVSLRLGQQQSELRALSDRIAPPTERIALNRTREGRLQSDRPGFFARLFRTTSFRDWTSAIENVRDAIVRDEGFVASLKPTMDTLANKVKQDSREQALLVTKLQRSRSELEGLRMSTAKERSELGAVVPDDDFFDRGHEQVQTANVWFDAAAGRMRDDLFEAAVQVHRAFVDCAADPIRQNLAVFMESFGTRTLGNPQKDRIFPDLWATFFLVVPVVSTTFASVNRMLSKLKPETLGWLLVDEAGQAVPQAVVGAMMRAKRAVVVGDPLQVEPVVTLPNSLTEEVCGYFGIDALKFNAPEASVQTLADAASIYSARFPSGSGHRDVGAPLLVHRRCNSPMFDISNEIAYSNLMVQAKRQAPVDEVLGPSAWVNVVGTSNQDKWFPDEGRVLVDMLRKLRQAGRDPDLYVITPFVIVQDNLRDVLVRSGVLHGWVEKPQEWVYDRVGTVHTVQGREAATVFFVLGAQASSQQGARAWAGSRPNLANVGVTRAKTSLYVIGNKAMWQSAGHFSTLSRYLPETGY